MIVIIDRKKGPYVHISVESDRTVPGFRPFLSKLKLKSHYILNFKCMVFYRELYFFVAFQLQSHFAIKNNEIICKL